MASLWDLVLRPRRSWSTVSDEVWNSPDDDEWAGSSELEVWLVNRLLRMAACMSPSGMSGWATVTTGAVAVVIIPGAVGGGGRVDVVVRVEEIGIGRDDCICKISSAFLEIAVERSCCCSCGAALAVASCCCCCCCCCCCFCCCLRCFCCRTRVCRRVTSCCWTTLGLRVVSVADGGGGG